MADSKISDLSELTLPASADLLAIVDYSASETKKISPLNLGIGTLGASAWVITNDAPTYIKTCGQKLQALGYPVRVCSGANDEGEVEALLADNTTVELIGDTITIGSDIDITGLSNVKLISKTNTKITKSVSITSMIDIYGSNHVEISGIQITQSDSNDNIGIRIYGGCTDIEIHDNDFNGLYNAVWMGSNVATANARIFIEDNMFRACTYSGIAHNDNTDYVYIRRNTFRDFVGESSNLYAYGNGTAGGYTTTYPGMDYIWFEDNTIINQDTWNSVDFHSGSHIHCNRNHFINCTRIAITYHTSLATYRSAEEDIEICDNTVDGLSSSYAYGAIYVGTEIGGFTIDGVKIEGNTIRDWTGSAIAIYAPNYASVVIKNISITDNQIAQDSDTGTSRAIRIYNDYSSGTPFQNVKVQDNQLYDVGEYGMYIEDASGLRVLNNQVDITATAAIYVTNCDDAKISENTITNATTYGIDMEDGDDVQITGNRIKAGTSIYINAAAAVRTMVHGNNWEGSTNDISKASATNARVRDNIDKDGAWYTDS